MDFWWEFFGDFELDSRFGNSWIGARFLSRWLQAALSRLDYGVAGVTVELVGLVSVTPFTLTNTSPTVVTSAGTVARIWLPLS